MGKTTSFPGMSSVARVIEVLERFACYGICFAFGIYISSPGFSRAQLGVVQGIFLLLQRHGAS